MIVAVTSNVSIKNVFLLLATNKVIVTVTLMATNVFLTNVSFDVNMDYNVQLEKDVLMTIVPSHQVINHLCDLLHCNP